MSEVSEYTGACRLLYWCGASDFLDGSTEDAKERLQELQQSTTSCGLPSVSVESKKLLADLVGVRPVLYTLGSQPSCAPYPAFPCLIVPAGYRSSLSLGDVIQTYTSTVLQLGKIGGRLRRQAVCLLAVVLDPAGEDAPALTKLLEQLPQVGC